jgi:hypothetical protein
MSTTFVLYIVDEEKLPKAFPALSGLEKYKIMAARVEKVGSRWESLEKFLWQSEALEEIDPLVTGGTGELTFEFIFGNSPHNLSFYDDDGDDDDDDDGDDGDDDDDDDDDDDIPAFGYLGPAVVKDLNDKYEAISEDEVERFLKDREYYVETVYYAFESAIREAAKRGYALAVLPVLDLDEL